MKLKFCFVLALLLTLLLCGCKKQQAAAGPGAGGMPPAPVSVAKAAQQAAPAELHVVGSVEASAIVQVKSQVAGELASVAFTEGQDVAKGDLLFAITNLARKLDLDAEHALREATDRFSRRFRYMEERLETDGRAIKSAPPEEQNTLWEAAKKAGVPLLVSDDSHFAVSQDKEVQDVRLAQSGAWKFFG